jgi:hypothetical protein
MKPGRVWLLPARLDDCDLPHFDLGGNWTLDSLQRIDLFGPGREDECPADVSRKGGSYGTKRGGCDRGGNRARSDL